MELNKNKENRTYSRADIDISVEVHSAPDSTTLEGNHLHCKARDISMTGMCIYSPVLLPAGSSLMITIELGTPARSYNVLGKVIWSDLDQSCGQYKTGIHLLKLPEDMAAWQTAVIQKLIG